MIDTDKYEGHTPAPWTVYTEEGQDAIYNVDNRAVRDIDGKTIAIIECPYCKEDEQLSYNNKILIADAPLLLAEVKRLKKELAFYTDNCTVVWMLDDVLSVDNTLSDEQASWVLERMEHKHDACLGISWDTIEFWISEVKKNG
tara:strand:- start:29142 stop:29570 length:429 start_codon:yes stop_codon:yes gene_type:complete